LTRKRRAVLEHDHRGAERRLAVGTTVTAKLADDIASH
jgi:hypothetical protein